MLRKNKTKSYAGLITKFTRGEINQLHSNAKPFLKEQGIFIKRASRTFEYARMLLIAPKKVGTAVVRNKIKRQLKTIFYQNELYTKAYDLIVYIYPEAVKLNYDELAQIIIKATNATR